VVVVVQLRGVRSRVQERLDAGVMESRGEFAKEEEEGEEGVSTTWLSLLVSLFGAE